VCFKANICAQLCCLDFKDKCVTCFSTVFGIHCECIAQKCTYLEHLPPLTSHLILLSHLVLTRHWGKKYCTTKGCTVSGIRNRFGWGQISNIGHLGYSRQSYPTGRTVSKVQNSDYLKLQVTTLLTEWKDSFNAENHESFIYNLFKFYVQIKSRCVNQQWGQALFCWVVMCNDLIFWFVLGKLTHGFFSKIFSMYAIRHLNSWNEWVGFCTTNWTDLLAYEFLLRSNSRLQYKPEQPRALLRSHCFGSSFPNDSAHFANSTFKLVFTTHPTWGDIFECCFKAQSSKLKARTSLWPRLSEKRPSSFELWALKELCENDTSNWIGCTTFKICQSLVFNHSAKCANSGFVQIHGGRHGLFTHYQVVEDSNLLDNCTAALLRSRR